MPMLTIAGINFDHMHMGDLLRLAFMHAEAKIVGVCDQQPERMAHAIREFNIPPERVFTDYRQCLEVTQPDIVLLCPATAQHAAWVERVAPYGAHILVEKPFASSLADADRMARAVAATGKTLMINWPLAWYPPHVTSKRLIDAGAIGTVLEVHYYDGNRGPLWHTADKIETAPTPEHKASSWFYRRAQGGGSMLDYLGYGVTLGTWYHGGKAPLEVTAIADEPTGLEVDEHSITILRYDSGLSKFETRWGTFTDPWTCQPQPKCGFVIVGTDGTISSYDYEPTIRLQTRAHPEGEQIPVDVLAAPYQDPIQYLIHCITTGQPVRGPTSPAMSRIGQQIVDTAILSAREKRALPLIN